MTIRNTFQHSLIAAALLALPFTPALAMTKADYKADKDRISAAYKQEKAACDRLSANAKDVCVEEAKAKEKVGKAELESNYTGKAKDANKVLVAKAESAYAVAKEKCDDQSGNAKDVCVKEAKAVDFKALADANIKTGMISTSEIKIAVMVDESDIDEAARVVHEAFNLGGQN